MDYNEIKKVIKDMEECSLEELDIEFTDGTKIKMKKHCEPKGAPRCLLWDLWDKCLLWGNL